MNISIIICTYNRCESLRDILDSLLNQEFQEKFDYEIIVVDNNSKDKTKEVVESYNSKFNGQLKYIFESNQGLSYARNRGIKETKGQIVAFTDDDCIVDRLWLNNLWNTFNNYRVDCVSGKTSLIYLAEKPSWLNKDMMTKLCFLTYGEETGFINSQKHRIVGCNFAVKKELLNKHRFRTDLGRSGLKLFSGEETELFSKIISEGAKALYQPNIIVYHKIPKQKLSKNYFRRNYFYTSRSMIKMQQPVEDCIRYFNIPRYLFRRLIENALNWIGSIFSLKSSKYSFEAELRCWSTFGQIYEYFKARTNN